MITESKTANACLSSEGFFKENVGFARLMFDHYDVSTVSVMPHDGFTQICQCADCRIQATRDRGSRGWYSDCVWNYVVRVADELGKTHPDKKVLCPSGFVVGKRMRARAVDFFRHGSGAQRFIGPT